MIEPKPEAEVIKPEPEAEVVEPEPEAEFVEPETEAEVVVNAQESMEEEDSSLLVNICKQWDLNEAR